MWKEKAPLIACGASRRKRQLRAPFLQHAASTELRPHEERKVIVPVLDASPPALLKADEWDAHPHSAWYFLESRYSGQLHAYFRRLQCAPEDRAEFVEQVLVEAFATACETHDLAQVDSRVHAVAREQAKRSMQRHRHEVWLTSPHFDRLAGSSRARRAEDRQARWEYLDSLLDNLTGSQRAALERHEADGIADDVIAQELGCAPSSIRVLRHRAKCRLRALVARGEFPPPPSE